MNEKLLTVREVAEILRYTHRRIYTIMAKGLLPYVRVGIGSGGIRIKESDLDAYIEGKQNVKQEIS